MKHNDKYGKITKFIITVMLSGFLPVAWADEYPLRRNVPIMVKNKEHNYKEADYINAYCSWKTEYVLKDGTRVDCLTEEYAIEFDWAKKWAESVGQALYYAKMTDKKPAVAIIMRSKRDIRYIKHIIKADKNIKIFKIRAYK